MASKAFFRATKATCNCLRSPTTYILLNFDGDRGLLNLAQPVRKYCLRRAKLTPTPTMGLVGLQMHNLILSWCHLCRTMPLKREHPYHSLRQNPTVMSFIVSSDPAEAHDGMSCFYNTYPVAYSNYPIRPAGRST